MTQQIVIAATTMSKIMGPVRTVRPTPVQVPCMVEGRPGFLNSYPRTEIYIRRRQTFLKFFYLGCDSSHYVPVPKIT